MVVPFIALLVILVIVGVVIYKGFQKKRAGKDLGEPGKKL